ncbi:MAG: transglutaminase family protein [Nitriliruptor sp.]|nr:MAG: transglutaminase family protein [Nitriliruptor sp.]
MRLDIRYLTRFRYAAPVSESQNELRACPATDHRQALVHYHVTTEPASRVASYVDYWGTRVDTFGVRERHPELEVVAEATVETQVPVRPQLPVPTAALGDERFHDTHLEFLQPSPHVRWSAEVARAARQVAAAADDDVAAIAQAVHDRLAEFEYRPGSTEVGVSVDEVFASGGGVCQDFAHLAAAMLRDLGIPARYVSGYLFTADDATGEDVGDDEVEVETHAWVEAAIPGWGWFALDPTNQQHVGERHVTIGRGRDYDDVSPLRGVFVGDQRHALEVSVSMRRLALAPLGDVGRGRSLQQQQQQ